MIGPIQKPKIIKEVAISLSNKIVLRQRKPTVLNSEKEGNKRVGN